jgi:hypothetical protein
MKPLFAVIPILAACLAPSLGAQSVSPTTYTLVMEATASDQKIPFTIYRDGDRERIEMGSPGSQMATLMDFGTHKVYWVNSFSGRQSCSAGKYLSVRAPVGQDPITGTKDSLAAMPAAAQRKFIRREVVNGIPARLEEITGSAKPASPDDVQPAHIWLAEAGGFMVKLEGKGKDGRPATILEVKRFSTAKPEPSLLAVPSNCPMTQSEMDDTGEMRAHGEATITAHASGEVNLGDQTKHSTGSASMETGKAPAPAVSNPNAKLTAVILDAVEQPYPGPCGRKLAVSGTVKTDGPATIWYRFYSNIGGVEFSGGQNGTITVDGSGSATMVKDATFQTNKEGEFRLQAAVQGDNGRHGGVTISNVVPFHFTCTTAFAK